MSVCTSTVAEKPPKLECASSSARIADESASAPLPPYSTGWRMPRKPRSPMRRSTARGICPASSQASPFGRTTSSTKRRTWVRSMSCSSVKCADVTWTSGLRRLARRSCVPPCYRCVPTSAAVPSAPGTTTGRRGFGGRRVRLNPEKPLDERSDLGDVGHDEEVSAPGDDVKPRAGQARGDHLRVDEWSDRIVVRREDQRRPVDEVKPGQARPSPDGHQLPEISAHARRPDEAQVAVLLEEARVRTRGAAVEDRSDLLEVGARVVAPRGGERPESPRVARNADPSGSRGRED